MNLKRILATTTVIMGVMLPTNVYAETKYVTAESGLNVRTANSTEAEKVDALPYGDSVEVKYITDDNWACVDWNGQEMFMYNQWLSAEESDIKEVVSTKNVETSNRSFFGNCRITHYCNCSTCCGSYAGGPTASGAYPTAGRTVAMSGFPFGTKVEINGHVYTVEDRGVSGNAVDIYVGSHSEALNKGMYYADVYVLS